MSGPLFKQECKANWKLAAIFVAVLSLYGGVIVSMFDPRMGDSLRAMAESMPEIFAAFNMLEVGSTMVEFVSNYLYGFLLVVFPLVFIALLSVRLIARKTERGSMACLLATPVPRWKLAATQALVLAVGVLLLVGYATGLVAALSEGMFPGELEFAPFIRLNAGLLGLLLFFAGICFCASCLFDTASTASVAGAGLCVLFVLVQMAGQVSNKFTWLKYCTPVTLFDRTVLLAGDGAAVGHALILYAAGLLLMGVGVAVFTRRDLSV